MTTDEIVQGMNRERKRQGIGYESLRKLAMIGSHTIEKWVCGATRPRLDVMIDVLDVLGLELVLRRKNNGKQG